jgi:hypothetical protein
LLAVCFSCEWASVVPSFGRRTGVAGDGFDEDLHGIFAF